jgi:hypothetical protein
VALEEAEKEKQIELGTKEELFAVDLVKFIIKTQSIGIQSGYQSSQMTIIHFIKCHNMYQNVYFLRISTQCE